MDTHPCCDCCAGIALSDHVGQGGEIEPNGHDLPCGSCGVDRLVREAKAEAWDEGWEARDASVWQTMNPHRD